MENLIPRQFFRGDLFAIMSVEEKLSRSSSQNVLFRCNKYPCFIENIPLHHLIPPGQQDPSEHPETSWKNPANILGTSREHLENIKMASIEYQEKIKKTSVII